MAHVPHSTSVLASCRAVVLAALAVPALAGCPREENTEPVTVGEATQALEETSGSAEADAVTGAAAEIATDFTLGQGVQRAVEDVRAFVASQLPCAELTLEVAKLTVVYGAKGGSCAYRGQTFTGTQVVEVSRAESGGVEVKHTWTDLSNGRVKVTGTASVTWSGGPGERVSARTVDRDLAWTRLRDGRTGRGVGRHVQSPLGGDWKTGVVFEGEHAWTGDAGAWELDFDGLETRWQDPVPQAGTITLTTPNAKKLRLSFARRDADTVRVEIEGGRRAYRFDVTRTGAVTAAGEVDYGS